MQAAAAAQQVLQRILSTMHAQLRSICNHLHAAAAARDSRDCNLLTLAFSVVAASAC